MRINHRRPDVGMAQERLDRSDIVVRLKKMGGEGVAKRMRGYTLRELSFSHRAIKRILKPSVMNMIAPLLPG
jgi:hypothetical protein